MGRAWTHSRLMATRNLIAVDLGAESGRIILGTWNGKQLQTREVYRFPNGPLRWNGTLRWNVVELWAHILKGLAAAARETGLARRAGRTARAAVLLPGQPDGRRV
jgi:sugar (pentulose or hexulose) kinase